MSASIVTTAGCTSFDRPLAIGPVLAELESLAPLAPAHQSAEIALIRSLQELLPGVPQIACFDTAFHRTQPKLSQWYALPRAPSESGIVRIGFHGLSHEYIAGMLPRIAGAYAMEEPWSRILAMAPACARFAASAAYPHPWSSLRWMD